MLPFLQALHTQNSYAIILLALVGTVWGLLAHRRGGGVDAWYAGLLMLTQVLIVLQAAVGVAFILMGRPLPEDRLHTAVYGPFSLLTLPVAYLYLRRRTIARRPLVYGLASLFLLGLSVRATLTA